MRCERGGFTLIELLVVVVIIGILAAAGVPQYFKVVERARAAEAQSTFSNIKAAQIRVMARNGKYTRNWEELDIAFSGPDGRPCGGAGGCQQKNFTYMLGGDGSIYATRNGRPSPPAAYGTYTLLYDINSGVISCTQVRCELDLV